jgi:DMSO/TMAO reductase YedYZ molybdopterin-dependent catalytic subunit
MIRSSYRWWTSAVAVGVSASLVLASTAGAQGSSIPEVTLTVVPAPGAAPVTLKSSDLAKLPLKRVETADGDQKMVFEGVTLVDVLLSVGFTFGQTMRGDRMSNYLVIESRDGYRVVYALPELDPAFTDDVVILAFRQDGKPLTQDNGPFRVVAPGHKRHARWARQVTALKIFAAAK